MKWSTSSCRSVSPVAMHASCGIAIAPAERQYTVLAFRSKKTGRCLAGGSLDIVDARRYVAARGRSDHHASALDGRARTPAHLLPRRPWLARPLSANRARLAGTALRSWPRTRRDRGARFERPHASRFPDRGSVRGAHGTALALHPGGALAGRAARLGRAPRRVAVGCAADARRGSGALARSSAALRQIG